MEKYYVYGIGFLAILGFSILPSLFKKIDQGLPSFLVMGISMFFLSAIALIMHFSFEPRVIPEKSTIALLLLAGAINAAAFYFMLVFLKDIPVWHYQMIALLLPITGSVAAYYILGEAFSYKLFIGAAIAAVGIYIAVKPS